MDDRKAVVRAGYAVIAQRYADWGAAVEGDPRHAMLATLAGRLPPRAAVLDLGCGAGLAARELPPGVAYTGVDLSAAQLALAQSNVPGGTFIEKDLSAVDFPAASFDAVIALYSVTHVPREEHASLFQRVFGWLRPDGRFLASLSAGDSPDWTGQWLGVPMFFSGHDAGRNRELLRAAGFRLEIADVVTIREPEGEVAFLWVLATRPR